MSPSKAVLALDVGDKRIGVAIADGIVSIARPLATVDVDGSEIEIINKMIQQEGITAVVIGYPRNQSGEPTLQTEYVENFAKLLTDIAPKLVFQDESLTSVLAEQQLKKYGRPYTKGDIDAQAAALILTDFLEQR